MDPRSLLRRFGPALLPLTFLAFVLAAPFLTRPVPEKAAAPAGRYERLVASARARTRSTSVAALKARRESGAPAFVLVDVREDGEWAKGGLPGAIHLSRGVLERDVEKAVPDLDAEIVLYCASGGRSTLAAESLQRMGYTRVYSLEGGARAWFASGEPVARR